MNQFVRIGLDPLAPTPVMYALTVLAVAGLVGYLVCGGRAILWRGILLALLVLALANPVWIRQERAPLRDIVAVVLDRSESMSLGDRSHKAQSTYDQLLADLEQDQTIQIRRARTPAGADATRVFDTVRSVLADVPRSRLAGAIVITDGQAHDIPDQPPSDPAPVHALIVGEKDALDRRVEIVSAPGFGFVGQTSQITVRATASSDNRLSVTLSINGQNIGSYSLTPGVARDIDITLPRRGSNLILAEVARIPGELTFANNSAVTDITGVRDRLRVLLVTGYPHAGGRVWRDLLKSDPSVDLVHFTILRPPFKNDTTPTRQLALIPFPTRELFVDRLSEFDLIILDQYQRRNVLPMAYFDNIASYVADGGALLTTSGKAFAGPASIYRTSLASILPARPTGRIVEKDTQLTLSDVGKRHTITAPLPASEDWGPWHRYIGALQASGDTLITAANGSPILLVDRVGRGRVATLMSDQLWLWARGHQGGGPYGELVRRTAHWLMREPELEEERLDLSTQDGSVRATLRSLRDSPDPLVLSDPEGNQQTLNWQQTAPGVFAAESPPGTSRLGLYQAQSGALTALTLNGPANPREYADIRVTEDILRPWTDASGGGVYWLSEAADIPRIRRTGRNARAAGKAWLGLTRNDAYRVESLQITSLLPGVLAMIMAVVLMMLAWRREGR